MESLAFEATQELGTNLEFHDFINGSNFEEFINVFREDHEDPITCFGPNYDCELMFNDGMVDNQFTPTPGNLFDFSSISTSDPNSLHNSLPPFSEDFEEDDEENRGDSSGTATISPTNRKMTDRSRTLISERRRRGRMKEKLYALRALVPNITKMDKASIIGDAVLYVQDMQVQAKKLRAEIAGLESSTKGGCKTSQGMVKNPKKIKLSNTGHSICKKILQMNVFQVEERNFYVRVVCNKGEGVAVPLHKAIESLTSFEVQSSNFSTASDSLILTFTVNVGECGEEMNLSTLQLWLTGALLNQGFEFRARIVP